MNNGMVDVTKLEEINMVVNSEERDSLGYKIKRSLYYFIKRSFDILCALLGLIILLPIALIVKICYLINGDYGSILYKHTRIGKDGKKFGLYKFRSMVNNADKVLEELLKDPKYKEEWDRYQKLENDPRITKIGKILRKTSLDELPQVLNVLKGDMSIIGPRPLIEGELDSHDGNHNIYEAVRPGLTSWWACNGRSNLEYGERLQLEYYYVRHQGIVMDIKCIFKTIKVVLFGNGAK